MNAAAIRRADEKADSRAIMSKVQRNLMPSNLLVFARHGLTVDHIDETSVRIAEKYVFFPATGYWKSNCGSLKGYSASTLIADIWIGDTMRGPMTLLPEIEESPADTRDSVEIELTLNSSHDPDNRAEAPAGEPVVDRVPTSATLPVNTL